VGRVDFQIHGLPVYALVAARYPCSLGLDLAFHLCEVIPPSAWDVVELCPFILPCNSSWCMRFMYFIVVRSVALTGKIDELEYKGPPCDDAAASREKIPANDVLEYR